MAKHKHMQISAGPTGLTVNDNLRSGNDNGIQQAVERTKLADEYSTQRARMKETQRSPQVVGSDVQLLAGKEEEVGAVDNRVVINTLVHLMDNAFECVSEALHKIEQTNLSHLTGRDSAVSTVVACGRSHVGRVQLRKQQRSSSRRRTRSHKRHVSGVELRNENTCKGARIDVTGDVASQNGGVRVVVRNILARSVVGNLDVESGRGQSGPVGRDGRRDSLGGEIGVVKDVESRESGPFDSRVLGRTRHEVRAQQLRGRL